MSEDFDITKDIMEFELSNVDMRRLESHISKLNDHCHSVFLEFTERERKIKLENFIMALAEDGYRRGFQQGVELSNCDDSEWKNKIYKWRFERKEYANSKVVIEEPPRRKESKHGL